MLSLRLKVLPLIILKQLFITQKYLLISLSSYHYQIYINKGTVSVCVCVCVRDQLIAKFCNFATLTHIDAKSTQHQTHPTPNPPDNKPT